MIWALRSAKNGCFCWEVIFGPKFEGKMACNVGAESMARYLKLTLFASLGFIASVGFGRRKDR